MEKLLDEMRDLSSCASVKVTWNMEYVPGTCSSKQDKNCSIVVLKLKAKYNPRIDVWVISNTIESHALLFVGGRLSS